jgi:hypothetical protein
MRIDATGDHEFSVGVQHLVRLHLEALPDNGDTLILDQNISLVIIDRSHHATVLDKGFHSATPI